MNQRTLRRLDLKLPDGDVDGQAQRPARLLELINGEFGERDALTRANLLVDADDGERWSAQRPGRKCGSTYPLMPMMCSQAGRRGTKREVHQLALLICLDA